MTTFTLFCLMNYLHRYLIMHLGYILPPGTMISNRMLRLKYNANKLLSDRVLTYIFDVNGFLQTENPFVNCDPVSNFSIINEIVSSYQEMCFYGSYDNNPHFSIASINSAWLSYRRGEGETDRGNLRIDPPICQYFLDKLDDEAFKIFMMHHPLDWLEENDRQTIENLLTANFDLILLGHNHNPASRFR